MQVESKYWDAFISHAWEDKETFVRPLVEALGRLGVSLWYDEISLKLGDSLSKSIDHGIAKSRNGIVVVSPAFIGKNWPEAELRALMTRRIDSGLHLFPIWLNVDKETIANYSPMLADLVALQTAERSAQEIALALLAEIRPDLYNDKGRSQLEKLATGEAFEELEEQLLDLRDKVSDLLCPHCEAPLSERSIASDDMDPDKADVDIFECGYVRGGYQPQACPHDPRFPDLSDYELTCKSADESSWICFAIPKTEAAKHHHIGGEHGPTKEIARSRLIERYNQGAPKNKQIRG